MGLRLSPGEQVRVRTRAHPRALAGPVARLMLVALIAGYLQGFLARGDLHEVIVQLRPGLVGTVWVLAAVAVLFGCVRPAWRWLSRTTALTTRRIIQRTGPGRSRERTLHLLAVYDVRIRQRRGQRMSGSGDLLVEHGPGDHWVLAGMPEAARFRDLVLTEAATLRHQVATHGAVPSPASPAGPAGGGHRG